MSPESHRWIGGVVVTAGIAVLLIGLALSFRHGRVGAALMVGGFLVSLAGLGVANGFDVPIHAQP